MGLKCWLFGHDLEVIAEDEGVTGPQQVRSCTRCSYREIDNELQEPVSNK